MTFDDLAIGDAVFVDANTLIYHFGPDPTLGPACSRLLQRIENQELHGFTSVHLLGEVAHKLMAIEAMARLGWPIPGMANRLRRHPEEVKKLSAFKIDLDQVAQSRMHVLSIVTGTLQNAATMSQQTGLLMNDSLIVALMQQQGLTRLASHDGDFDRLPSLTRYAPT